LLLLSSCLVCVPAKGKSFLSKPSIGLKYVCTISSVP
jgi:hypothetical protein